MNQIAILQAPSILGLRPSGVETLPEALLRNNLVERLRARLAGGIVPRHSYNFQRDAESGMLNVPGLVAYSPRLAQAVHEVLECGDWPLVLGGDCSILLGTMLALRQRGRYGLLFLDGHADYYQAEANPNGEAASMELALVTGRGPASLTNLGGFSSLVRDEDVVTLGIRDHEEQKAYGSQPLPKSMLALDLSRIRKEGLKSSAELAIGRLTRPELEGFWIHLDADVLDDAAMPAVDYRLPGGLSVLELVEVLQLAVGTGKAVGLEVTIFNPRLDETGALGARFADAIVDGVTGTKADRQLPR
ncbi:MAG: arginase family protein [Bryobacteraceae bacterium]|nr:arginase family protein [Bryobacteraceae bacterium]